MTADHDEQLLQVFILGLQAGWQSATSTFTTMSPFLSLHLLAHVIDDIRKDPVPRTAITDAAGLTYRGEMTDPIAIPIVVRGCNGHHGGGDS